MTTNIPSQDRLPDPHLETTDGARVSDLVGIGFGPANLSLAIAIEEANAEAPCGARITTRFVESQPQFAWHDGMMLPRAEMQISFLKDLVLLRNPQSSYTFLSYLQDQGRLIDFVNLKSFFPTRREFHGYLDWAASRVTAPVEYGVTATRIERNDEHFTVSVTSSDGRRRTLSARNVALGLGTQAWLPDRVTPGRRVFHNHRLLHQLADLGPLRHGRFVVIGSGQSAAEVAAYLHDTYPDAEIHASFRRFGYTPSDNSPFANRIFDPESVDEFYTASPELKTKLLEYHWNTNYSAVDPTLIDELYRREYDESVRGRRRLVIHRVTAVDEVREEDDGVFVTLRDLGDRGSIALTADAVVCATGFRARDLRALLGPSIDHSRSFDGDEPLVDRDYRLRLPGGSGGIYLNGGVQHSHGLTSSLLSNVSARAADILRAIANEPAVVPH